MKRAIHGSLVAFLSIVALATPSFAGQSNGGGSGPKNPIGAGANQDQSNGNLTGQNGTNGSSIHGNGNAVNQTVNNQNDTTQINNIDQSIKPNTNSSATSGSSSSNGLVQNTNSKVDGRQDGGVPQVILPSSYTNTNTFGKFSNICGVTTSEVGVTPVTKSFSVGVNLFGVGGGSIGSSNQKFTKEQKAMLVTIAQGASRSNAEISSFMSNPVLRKVYIKQAFKAMFVSEGMKPEQAALEADSIATEAASIDPSSLVRSTAEFCSIYKQGITPVAEPQVEQPPAPIEIPSVPAPVEALN
jgi:hypothetical protein